MDKFSKAATAAETRRSRLYFEPSSAIARNRKAAL